MLLVAKPLVIAHRGASAEAPENTLAAFRRALAIGVDGIELDVQLSRDGVPVVFHDARLRRLTGVSGRVQQKTWRELSTLQVNGRAAFPRLTEVLRLTRSRAVVQIELKAGAAVAPVVRAVRAAHAMQWVIFASFAPDLVRDARRLAPTVPRMLISAGRQTPASLARHLANLGASGLSVDHRAVAGPEWVAYFSARGFTVWSWTVNDARTARRLAGWGIDGLLGDNPALLKRVV